MVYAVAGLALWLGVLTVLLGMLALRTSWLEDTSQKLVHMLGRHTDVLVNHASTVRGMLRAFGFVEDTPEDPADPKASRHLHSVPKPPSDEVH